MAHSRSSLNVCSLLLSEGFLSEKHREKQTEGGHLWWKGLGVKWTEKGRKRQILLHLLPEVIPSGSPRAQDMPAPMSPQKMTAP